MAEWQLRSLVTGFEPLGGLNSAYRRWTQHASVSVCGIIDCVSGVVWSEHHEARVLHYDDEDCQFVERYTSVQKPCLWRVLRQSSCLMVNNRKIQTEEKSKIWIVVQSVVWKQAILEFLAKNWRRLKILSPPEGGLSRVWGQRWRKPWRQTAFWYGFHPHLVYTKARLMTIHI